jgi:hypothetical protein
MLSIITLDGDTFTEKKQRLRRVFRTIQNLILDFPEADDIYPNISSTGWQIMSNFIDYLEIPSGPEELITLAKAADYLEIVNPYKKVLMEGMEEKIKDLGLRFFLCPDPSFLDIVARLELGDEHITAGEDGYACVATDENGKRCHDWRWCEWDTTCFRHSPEGRGPPEILGPGRPYNY